MSWVTVVTMNAADFWRDMERRFVWHQPMLRNIAEDSRIQVNRSESQWSCCDNVVQI
jgi:hypothetical protein